VNAKRQAVHHDLNGAIVCGLPSPGSRRQSVVAGLHPATAETVNTTTDPARVTCKRCRRGFAIVERRRRLWEQQQRKRPSVGDRAFAVDWCAAIPLDENGDADMDRADDRCEHFATEEAAARRVAEVLPLDAFGVVQVTPVEFVPYDDDAERFPHAGFWQATGETVNHER
jgi:hypothetical protein